MNDTIFALSSGLPPAGVAVIRISGDCAGSALVALAGSLPKSRRATLRTLRDLNGLELDAALVLWMPGPGSATGEDCAELHLHGGRAVVAAVERALSDLPGLRRAEAGEFTRRSFANGRLDLAEAEGLADLLSAETELQRRTALAMAGGALSRQVEDWRLRVLTLSAAIEATLDFSDEGEVGDHLPSGFGKRCAALQAELEDWLSRPRAEPLKEGFRIVLAGPPNAGKSTLFNALIGKDAAITAPEAGTTRDVLTSYIAIEGVPLVIVDTAGLRDSIDIGHVETIGIERARAAAEQGDLVLWLGAEGQGPPGNRTWEIAAKCDDPEHIAKHRARHCLSAQTGQGFDALKADLVATARSSLPKPGAAALNKRQYSLVAAANVALTACASETDPLLVAEALRLARAAFDRLLGRTGIEDVLDALFGRFCIGK